MKETKNKTKRVAIQGGYGAFHEIAATHYFKDENIEVIPSVTFNDLFENLNSRHADYGIMAIENMVAGSIIPNYKLLKESNMKIIGEIYLRIKQNLVALPGQKIEDIKEVYSHPMAILQCQDFFKKYPHIRSIDSADTALSAKEIRDKKITGVAAISSEMAAKMYNLEILEESIESNKKNYTRFLILKDKNGDSVQDDTANKASLSFALAHEIGSLSKILSIFSFFNINLTKIQSLPIIGKDWEYQFYVDVEIHDYKTYLQSLESVKPFTSIFEILGEYKKGISIIES
ncbi:MAG: prephenate dehydratase [Bacteroidales bacterium]|nr:prephenate dehydratase [Bacteroidales bacterium]